MCAGTYATQNAFEFRGAAQLDECVSARSPGPISVSDLDAFCSRKPNRRVRRTGRLLSISRVPPKQLAKLAQAFAKTQSCMDLPLRIQPSASRLLSLEQD